jgi:hypothetical protein
MEYTVGIVLAFGVAVFARATGLDRDRAFYATVAMVVASYYVLFAALGGSTQGLVAESSIMAAFAAVVVMGFKRNLWLVVVALAAHGVLDVFHGRVLANPGVPDAWPAFCMAYDVVAAGFLAWLLLRAKLAVRPVESNGAAVDLRAGSSRRGASIAGGQRQSAVASVQSGR